MKVYLFNITRLCHGKSGNIHEKYERGGFVQKAKKQAAKEPLSLKEWIYAADGKHITELIKTSFLEFYFAKQTIENRQNA
jgi:hypothetical protein